MALVRALSALIPALILVACAPDAALADTCAADPVTAHGEPSSFEWLAKTKARANWRQRVRMIKALGPLYSTWSRAQESKETCSHSPKGIVCTFTGIPCKL
jgi:hypothetical protein